MSAPVECSLAGRHAPANLTVEQHHPVVVAWQLFWRPVAPPFPGRDPDGRGMLWDARTVTLCPTHHRNAHALIVMLMHWVSSSGRDTVPQLKVPRRLRSTLQVAELSLQRFLDAGGSLLALTAAGLWGEA